jgi:AcrR family transcriptional regulator
MFAACGSQKPRPRDRIVGTARDLFRKHGLRGIGVDAIAEAAGTNKMTLYRHFASKDDLIVACLREVAAEADAFWVDIDTAHPGDPMAQLHAWVACAAEYAIADGHGCDIANAAVELTAPDHPARKVVEEFKTVQRARLADLCRATGIAQPDLLTDALILLIEGARVNWQSVGSVGPGARFAQIAEAVIASFANKHVPAAQSSTIQNGPVIQDDPVIQDSGAFERLAG